jgi:hypothetical protein
MPAGGGDRAVGVRRHAPREVVRVIVFGGAAVNCSQKLRAEVNIFGPARGAGRGDGDALGAAQLGSFLASLRRFPATKSLRSKEPIPSSNRPREIHSGGRVSRTAG